MPYRLMPGLAVLLFVAGCADPQGGQRVVVDPNQFTLDTPIEQLAANGPATDVLRKDIPGLLEDKSYPMFKSMSLRTIGALSNGELTPQTLARTEADLWIVSPANATTALK